MPEFVTVWDDNTEAPAELTDRVLIDDSDPLAPVYQDQVVRVLERVPWSEIDWSRPVWADPAIRANPAGHGAVNFKAGWRILNVVDDKPAPVPGQRLSAAPTGPGVPDKASGIITYPWALLGLAGADLTAAVVTAATKKKAEIHAERERRVYLPIGPVDVAGDGSLMVEPDIRNSADRDNLVAIHTRALQLHHAGVTAAVVTFGAADNVEYQLTPAQALTLCSAPFDRASLLYQKARALKDGALAAAVAAEDLAALAAIDPTADAHWT